MTLPVPCKFESCPMCYPHVQRFTWGPISGFYRERDTTVRFGRHRITTAENSLISIANVQRQSHQQCQIGYSSLPEHFCLTLVLNTSQAEPRTSLLPGPPYLVVSGWSSFLHWTLLGSLHQGVARVCNPGAVLKQGKTKHTATCRHPNRCWVTALGTHNCFCT